MKTLYPNVPAAVGAWVAAEMTAAMQNPELMLPRCDPDEPVDDPHAPAGHAVFDGVTFEDHLDGMLSDFIEYCCAGLPPGSPCYLCVTPDAPANVDSQKCLQGYAYIERS